MFHPKQVGEGPRVASRNGTFSELLPGLKFNFHSCRLPLFRAYNTSHHEESFGELYVRSIQLPARLGGGSHLQR